MWGREPADDWEARLRPLGPRRHNGGLDERPIPYYNTLFQMSNFSCNGTLTMSKKTTTVILSLSLSLSLSVSLNLNLNLNLCLLLA